MNIARIKFLQNEQGLWYWQYVDEFQVIQAEGTKLYESLQAAVESAELVCGLKIEMDYSAERFGYMNRLWVYRDKPVGIQTVIGLPVSDKPVIISVAEAHAISDLIVP